MSKVLGGFHVRGKGYPWITVYVPTAGVWHLYVKKVPGGAHDKGTKAVPWDGYFLTVIDYSD